MEMKLGARMIQVRQQQVNVGASSWEILAANDDPLRSSH
jgi:hypothetical protein